MRMIHRLGIQDCVPIGPHLKALAHMSRRVPSVDFAPIDVQGRMGDSVPLWMRLLTAIGESLVVRDSIRDQERILAFG